MVKTDPECGDFRIEIYKRFWVCSSQIFEALEVTQGCLVKSLYFIQSAYTIYLCMSMVIYLFYLL
jgi:hypothetical protein